MATVDIDVLRHIHEGHLVKVAGCAEHERGRDGTVAQHPALVIHVEVK
ncbi:MAG TPA: hypothetical protein VH916_07515 [Dehalococcoidia bacterium]|jgi:hypothetical protein